MFVLRFGNPVKRIEAEACFFRLGREPGSKDLKVSKYPSLDFYRVEAICKLRVKQTLVGISKQPFREGSFVKLRITRSR